MKNQINQATARPWTVQEGKTLFHIETANMGDGKPCGMAVCSIPKKRSADAELIVRAVNEHAALVAVAEAAARMANSIPARMAAKTVMTGKLDLALSNLAAVRNQ